MAPGLSAVVFGGLVVLLLFIVLFLSLLTATCFLWALSLHQSWNLQGLSQRVRLQQGKPRVLAPDCRGVPSLPSICRGGDLSEAAQSLGTRWEPGGLRV